MSYDDLWLSILSADSISKIINQQIAMNRILAEHQDSNLFLSNNYACIILSKEKELIGSHFLKKDEYEYYFNCYGLNTNTICRVLVGKKLWNDCKEREIVRFEKNFNQIDLDDFLNKNDEVRVVDKISDDSTRLVKLCGLPSGEFFFVNVDENDYVENKIADFIKKKEDYFDDNDSDLEDEEDTWYNIPMTGVTTLEMENTISNCPPDGYVYFYLGDHIFPKEINDVCEKIISIKNNISIIKTFTKMFKEGLTFDDEKLLKYINKNKELFELYRKLVIYMQENPIDDEYMDLDNLHIANSNQKIFGLFIDDIIPMEELELMTMAMGIARVKKEFFDKYPIQARRNFCNIVNSVFGLSIWFEKGKIRNKHTLKKCNI